MLTYDFQLKVKALDDTGAFSGYASTYGPPADLCGDIVEPGAFKQAIQQQGKGYPLLWAHLQSEPLGLARVSDSTTGLVVDGSLLMKDPAAQRAYDHLRLGSFKGISIGYSVPSGAGKVMYADDGTRTLKEIRLHEISLVAVPANSRATVTAVKALPDVRNVLRSLRDGDIEDGLAELLDIDREIKRLLVGHDPQEARAEALAALRGLAAELLRFS